MLWPRPITEFPPHVHVTKKCWFCPSVADGEERKPFGRSKVYPSSSMTKASGLDAAGSVRRPRTPKENNVSVMEKEAKVKTMLYFS